MSFPSLGSGTRRVDHGTDLSDAVGREAAVVRVLLDQIFARGRVNAIDLVAGDVRMDPLDIGPELIENAARLLRSGHQVIRRHISRSGNITLYYKFWHLLSPEIRLTELSVRLGMSDNSRYSRSL